MNLEAIEQQSFNYLGQVANPLVRVEVLLAHLRDRGVAAEIDRKQLQTFLERHPDFRIMEAPALTADSREADTDVYVILATRIPTPEQLGVMMLDQITALEHALVVARAEAHELGDPARIEPIDQTLKKVAALRKKLEPPSDAAS